MGAGVDDRGVDGLAAGGAGVDSCEAGAEVCVGSIGRFFFCGTQCE